MWYVSKRKTYSDDGADDMDGYPVETGLGRCRRRSPTINGFPAVFNVDWCGDHKLDENKI